MDSDSSHPLANGQRRGWPAYLLEVLLAVAILGVVAPVAGAIAFELIFNLPVWLFRQPKESMLGWGWITTPIAMFATPPIAVGLAYLLLRLITKRVWYYLAGAALLYSVLLGATPLWDLFLSVTDWFQSLIVPR